MLWHGLSFSIIKSGQLIISSVYTKEKWRFPQDVALGPGWGAGDCRADPRAWAGLMDGGEEGTCLGTPIMLGLSDFEVDSNFETIPLTPL